jgi:P27 family predicted phage terminase small subunit
MPRGQRPKPTAIQIVEGDPRRLGKNRLQEKLEREPKATEGLPRCPRHLKGYARGAWNYWRKELQRMGLDRRPDAQMLEGACMAYEDTVWAYKTILKQGRMIPKRARDAAGNWVVVGLVTHPAVRQRNQAMMILKAFCDEFGLTPAARTRLSVEPPDDEEDDLMKLLWQPRTNRRVFPETS